MRSTVRRITLKVDKATRVHAIWTAPSRPTACLVIAHGAGAGMEHPFLASLSSLLLKRSIAILRYQFPYMERGSKRPDRPGVCHATVRAAVAEAARCTTAPIFAGGKSFGGRMTSQAETVEHLPQVRGLVFVGFPLHPAGKPSTQRAEHLKDVHIPMLFLQGTRDGLADLPLLRASIRSLQPLATLTLFAEADHAFHVPARTGRTDDEVLEDMADDIARWVKRNRALPSLR